MPRNRTRAQRRIAQRTEINAQARVAAGLVDPDAVPIRRHVRHQTVVETLFNRGSISRAQVRAAERLEAKWRASGGVLGNLVAEYSPRFKDKKRTPLFEGDTAHAIACRLEFEGALQELGRWLAPVVVHTVLCDLPPADWARANGKPNPDALGLLRQALDALCEFYSRPARDRRPRRDPPLPPPPAPLPVNGHRIAAPAPAPPPDPVVVVDPVVAQPANGPPGPTLGDLMTAATLGEMADDRLIERALLYAQQHGELGDELDAVVERLTTVAEAPRPAPPAIRLREPYHHWRPA